MDARVCEQDLQMQVDFNLFGMGFMRLGEAWFRGPVPQTGTPRRPGWKQVDSLLHHEVSPSGGLYLIMPPPQNPCPPHGLYFDFRLPTPSQIPRIMGGAHTSLPTMSIATFGHQVPGEPAWIGDSSKEAWCV